MRQLFTLFAVFLTCAVMAHAHEVRPSIGDLSTPEGKVKLAIELGSAEPILAGVNLSTVTDTNDSELSEEVDALRALAALQIAARVRAMPEEIFAPMTLSADGAPLDLELIHVETDEEPNEDLPRTTRVFFEAQLPEGARVVQLDWPAEFGTLILRQIDVDGGYTGYLSGGLSDEIPIAGGAAGSVLETIGSFVPVGFDHVLPSGLDDILFMLGLFFLTTRFMPMLWQLASLTLAHVATVAVGAIGGLSLAPEITGPVLAACIVFVALENIYADRPGLLRLAVIFVFVFLHGQGFASALQGFEARPDLLVAALIGFNLGFEIGQLAVITFAFASVWLLLRIEAGEFGRSLGQGVYGAAMLLLFGLGFALDGPGFATAMGAGAPAVLWPLAGFCLLCAVACRFTNGENTYQRFVAMPASVAIACVGLFWFAERVL